jgi:hypothetical protein
MTPLMAMLFILWITEEKVSTPMFLVASLSWFILTVLQSDIFAAFVRGLQGYY